MKELKCVSRSIEVDVAGIILLGTIKMIRQKTVSGAESVARIGCSNRLLESVARIVLYAHDDLANKQSRA